MTFFFFLDVEGQRILFEQDDPPKDPRNRHLRAQNPVRPKTRNPKRAGIFTGQPRYGLLGSLHCLGMCGGLTAAISFGIPAQAAHTRLILLTSLGRVASYGLMGLVLGALVQSSASAPGRAYSRLFYWC